MGISTRQALIMQIEQVNNEVSVIKLYELFFSNLQVKTIIN